MNNHIQQMDDAVLSVGVLQSLRRRAEDSQRGKVALPLHIVKEMKPEDAQLLFHELRVHQIELELQNEELRRAQLALEVARERYFDLYDMAPVGYCTVDEQGQILEANLTAATLLGVSRSALVMRRMARFMTPTQQALYQQCCQRVHATRETQTCELQLHPATGGPMWVSLAINVARSLEGVSTLRVMLKDIRERKLLAEQLQQRNVELEHSREVADKANRAKSDFLASMSHELRSPLNAILGFAQLIDAGKPAPTAAQKLAIDQILHGGWYLLELVNEILDLASIEAGQLAISMASESLTEVLQDCQAMIGPQADASGIGVTFPQLQPDCRVRADRRRLKQVLINLLSNAIKYNRPHGSVDVGWSLRPGSRVRVSVKDSGLGLAPGQLAQLFQPFNRLGQETGAQEGTGIGLTVSKRLLELMGGSVGATSTVGVGSVFWFELALEGTAA
jgi:PAS domain S-box-containing protein